jgi:hypothetical protein
MSEFTVESVSTDKPLQRTVRTRFTILDERFSRNESISTDRYQPALEVSTSHDKDRKAYVTYINRMLVSPAMVRMVIDYNQDDAPPVQTAVYVRTARYNAKAMHERHQQILDNIEAMGPETHEALWAWTTRAKGL